MKHEFLSFETIGSTNDYLKERYRSFSDGLVCEALFQTKGRGRLGRVWEGEKESLLFSLLLKDEKALALTSLLPLISGSALLKTFEELGLSPSLKWPNDIYIGEKKVAGILVEGVYEREQEAAIIGIGINVANESFPASLPNATSLYLESGKLFSKDEIVSSFLSTFDYYLQEKINGQDTFFLDIPSHDYLKEKSLSFDYYKENIVGTSLGIQADGSIRIRNEEGKDITIASGEANLRKSQ